MITSLELSEKDIRILVQSLGNCLATCQRKAGQPDAPCEDCEAARELQKRLQRQLTA
jgi:hypothetical protein